MLWYIFLAITALAVYVFVQMAIGDPSDKFKRLLRYLDEPFEEHPMDSVFHGAAQCGDVGTVHSQLHPVGKAWFDSVLVDVASEGNVVEPGTLVSVIERRGNRIVVRAITGGGAWSSHGPEPQRR